MTLVATFRGNNTFLMMGDALLSTDRPDLVPKRLTRIPNREDLAELFPEDFERRPIDLAQKITVINKNLVVGWAGSAIHARAIIRLLKRDTDEDKSYPMDYFHNFLVNSGKHEPDKIDFLVLASDGERVYRQAFGKDVARYSYPGFGEVHSIGTGVHDLHSVLGMRQDEHHESGDLNDIRKAVTQIYVVTSQLNANEINNALNLYWGYGGCYEIAAYWDGRFQKIPEVTYLSWSLEQKPEGSFELFFTGLITKHFYIKELLIIRKAQLIVSEEALEEVKEEMVCVPPILKPEPFSEQFKLPGYSSRFTCSNVYYHDDATNTIRPMNVVYGCAEDNLPMKFRFAGTKMIGFEFRPAFLENLISVISEAARAPRPIPVVIRTPEF